MARSRSRHLPLLKPSPRLKRSRLRPFRGRARRLPLRIRLLCRRPLLPRRLTASQNPKPHLLRLHRLLRSRRHPIPPRLQPLPRFPLPERALFLTLPLHLQLHLQSQLLPFPQKLPRRFPNRRRWSPAPILPFRSPCRRLPFSSLNRTRFPSHLHPGPRLLCRGRGCSCRHRLLFPLPCRFRHRPGMATRFPMRTSWISGDRSTLNHRFHGFPGLPAPPGRSSWRFCFGNGSDVPALPCRPGGSRLKNWPPAGR